MRDSVVFYGNVEENALVTRSKVSSFAFLLFIYLIIV